MTRISDPKLPQVGKTIKLHDKKWHIVSEISHEGPFSSVFVVESEGVKYAMKVEKQHGCVRPVLKLDHIVLSRLTGTVGFPSLAASGRTSQFKFVVMQLVGPDLATLLENMPERRFSDSTIYQIALQTLNRLAVLHRAGWLNRDLKTNNFAVGLGAESSTVYMLDFGLTKQYKDKTGKRFLLRSYGPCVGTFPYAPLMSSSFRDQNPLDDLEGWLYMVIHLLRGGLPWHNPRTHLDNARCREWKMYARREAGKRRLFYGIPHGWTKIFDLILLSNPAEDPNYELISLMISRIADEERIDLNKPFDWQVDPIGRQLVGLDPVPTQYDLATLDPTQTETFNISIKA